MITKNMYLFIEIRHNILWQCQWNYVEVTKFNYLLWIDIFRNSSQKWVKSFFRVWMCKWSPDTLLAKTMLPSLIRSNGWLYLLKWGDKWTPNSKVRANSLGVLSVKRKCKRKIWSTTLNFHTNFIQNIFTVSINARLHNQHSPVLQKWLLIFMMIIIFIFKRVTY